MSNEKICELGCGRPARFVLKTGKACCESMSNSCPEMRRKNSESHKGLTGRVTSEAQKRLLSKIAKEKGYGGYRRGGGQGVKVYINGHSHNYYTLYTNGVYDLDAGNAGNDTDGNGYTFFDIIVGTSSVQYDIWRDITKNGRWVKSADSFLIPIP